VFFFNVLLIVYSGMILVNNQLDQQFFMCVYFYSLHVSGSHVPIIRRIIVSMRHPVYRLKKSNKMQQYADIYLLLNYCTCVRYPMRPSSGVHKTVGVASATVLIWSRLRKFAATTVLCTPDDGLDGRPKHVQ